MQVRPADRTDRPAIREVAEESFRSSYALSPAQIELIVDAAFTDDALSDRLADDAAVVSVAEEGGDVLGFADVELGTDGALRWLHVAPTARGRGAGTALVNDARDELEERGLPFTARVLESASEGGAFLERFGLQKTGSLPVEFGGERFYAQVYAAGEPTTDPNEPTVAVPDAIEVDGGERPLDRDEPIPGTEAPIFVVFRDADHDERYGYFCSNCSSTAVSADGMDRLECGTCGNRHLADEWDDAYL